MWNIIVSFPMAIFGFMFLLGYLDSLYSEIFPTEIRNTAMNASFNLAHGVQFFTPVIIAVLGKSYGLSSGIFWEQFLLFLPDFGYGNSLKPRKEILEI